MDEALNDEDKQRAIGIIMALRAGSEILNDYLESIEDWSDMMRAAVLLTVWLNIELEESYNDVPALLQNLAMGRGPGDRA